MSVIEGGGPSGASTLEWTRAEVIRTSASFAIGIGLIIGAFVLSATSNGDSTKPFSLLLGAGVGLVFERGRFCFFCIFREAIEERKTTGLLSVVTALAVGAIGHAVVFGLYLPNPKGEGLPPSAHISPVSEPLVIGALAFGLGMALSGACISGHLYRLGQGYLRAIPALVGSLVGFGLGFITWNTLYLDFISERSIGWLPRWFGYGGSLVLVLFVLGVAAFVLARVDRTPADDKTAKYVASTGWEGALRNPWRPVPTGALVGGLGVLAYFRLDPLGVTSQLSTWSRTFMDGRELLPEVMNGIDMMTGCVGVVTSAITNNGWLVIGIVGASLASALSSGRFRPSRPTLGNSVTALLGGVLMGWGSMTALGCTVGNLLSGVQSFAVSGIVFGLAAFVGVLIGVKLRLHRLFGG